MSRSRSEEFVGRLVFTEGDGGPGSTVVAVGVANHNGTGADMELARTHVEARDRYLCLQLPIQQIPYAKCEVDSRVLWVGGSRFMARV